MNKSIVAGTKEDSDLKVLAEVPLAPKFNPVAESIAKANDLGAKTIATALGYFASMPASTGIIANPVLHHIPVKCQDSQVTLDIRSFTIRGILPEHDIVNGKAGPLTVIFVGLFGHQPEAGDEVMLGQRLEEDFFASLGFADEEGLFGTTLIDQVAVFLKEFPNLGPETVTQYFSSLRKAQLSNKENGDLGVNEEREPASLLSELFRVHMENVAIGAITAYINQQLASDPQQSPADLARSAREFVSDEKSRGRTAFQTCYSLILGHHANDSETLIMERLGTLQIHHGSAGSNMVARYMATLHAMSVSDFFVASQMAMDGARHFGAIHDISEFIRHLEGLPIETRKDLIRERLLGGGLPGFGHPEIAAAGRGLNVQQDPRPAIYLDPVFKAIDDAQIVLTDAQKQRLSIADQIYKIALVQGVFKPQREHEPPLRLTPNTDFGAWCAQEALDIREVNRTLLTYMFRGFGWMMDAREQLQQKIIRPVIAPDPAIIPTSSDDPSIPDIVVKTHQRLSGDNSFGPNRI